MQAISWSYYKIKKLGELYMSKKNSSNKHEKKYPRDTKGNNNFFKSISLIITSILIVCGIGFYLKNISKSNLQKSEANKLLSEDVKDSSEENIKQEDTKKEPVKK